MLNPMRSRFAQSTYVSVLTSQVSWQRNWETRGQNLYNNNFDKTIFFLTKQSGDPSPK